MSPFLVRSVHQAKLLGDTIDVIKVIHLVADQAKMVERLRRRALKENRVDDASDEVIARRFDVYQKETKPVLEHYSSDIVVRIDAAQSQIRVLSEIIRVLVPLKESLDVYREKAYDAEEANEFATAAVTG